MLPTYFNILFFFVLLNFFLITYHFFGFNLFTERKRNMKTASFKMRHYVVKNNKTDIHYIVSGISYQVLKLINKNPNSEYCYQDISEKLDVPKNTLYVMVDRLVKSRLVSREKLITIRGGLRRTRTIVKANPDIDMDIKCKRVR